MSLSTPFLDSSSSSSKGVKRKWSLRDGSMDIKSELPFCHWLDGSSGSSDSKASSTTTSSLIETDEESSMEIELDFTLHLGNEKTPLKKKPPSSFNTTSLDLQDQVDLELTLSSTPTSSITSLSVITQQQQQRIISTKICHYNGCEKQTRGVSGHCISHRGGRRCQKSDCKGHGGGKRCKYEGCGKSTQGSTDFCKVHGALVKDERVHGGATLGPLVLDTKSGPLEKGCYEDMNVDVNVVTSSRVSEGRVHGGSLIAFLAGNSVGLLDSGKVNMVP